MLSIYRERLRQVEQQWAELDLRLRMGLRQRRSAEKVNWKLSKQIRDAEKALGDLT